jgi:hypothetical protein
MREINTKVFAIRQSPNVIDYFLPMRLTNFLIPQFLKSAAR